MIIFICSTKFGSFWYFDKNNKKCINYNSNEQFFYRSNRLLNNNNLSFYIDECKKCNIDYLSLLNILRVYYPMINNIIN